MNQQDSKRSSSQPLLGYLLGVPMNEDLFLYCRLAAPDMWVRAALNTSWLLPIWQIQLMCLQKQWKFPAAS